MIKSKKCKIVSILLLLFLVVFYASLVNGCKERTKSAPKTLKIEDKLKATHRFNEIDEINKLSNAKRTRPDYLGFSRGVLYLEKNTKDEKFVRTTDQVYKYDIYKDEVIDIFTVKENIKFMSMNHLDDTLIYSYIDCNNINNSNIFHYTIAKFDNNKETVLKEYSFYIDNMSPIFVYQNNKIYFLTIQIDDSQVNDSKIESGNYDVIQTLYEFNGDDINPVYHLTTQMRDYYPDKNSHYISSTNLYHNLNGSIAFQEFGENENLINIMTNNDITTIKLDDLNDVLLSLVGDEAFVYNSTNDNFRFFNIKTKTHRTVGKLERIYEVMNYCDQYLLFLKEDSNHYYISKDNYSPTKLKTTDGNNQRSFIFSDGYNIILQVSDLSNDIAKFYILDKY